jgi:hypothetical protein
MNLGETTAREQTWKETEHFLNQFFIRIWEIRRKHLWRRKAQGKQGRWDIAQGVKRDEFSFYYSFIHMCIQCSGHRSPVPPAPSLSSPPTSFPGRKR